MFDFGQKAGSLTARARGVLPVVGAIACLAGALAVSFVLLQSGLKQSRKEVQRLRALEAMHWSQLLQTDLERLTLVGGIPATSDAVAKQKAAMAGHAGRLAPLVPETQRPLVRQISALGSVPQMPEGAAMDDLRKRLAALDRELRAQLVALQGNGRWVEVTLASLGNVATLQRLLLQGDQPGPALRVQAEAALGALEKNVADLPELSRAAGALRASLLSGEGDPFPASPEIAAAASAQLEKLEKALLAAHDSLVRKASTSALLHTIGQYGLWGLAALTILAGGLLLRGVKRPDEPAAEAAAAQVAPAGTECVLVVGIDTNRIVSASPDAELLLGIPAGELHGKEATRFLPETLLSKAAPGPSESGSTRCAVSRADGQQIELEIESQEALFSGQRCRVLRLQVPVPAEVCPQKGSRLAALMGQQFLEQAAAEFAELAPKSTVLLATVDQSGLEGRYCTAVVVQDGKRGRDFEATLRGTPAEMLFKQGSFFCPAGLGDMFPLDTKLRDWRPSSGFGAILEAPEIGPCGFLMIYSRQPMRDRQVFQTAVAPLLGRLGGELYRVTAERDRDEERKRLSLLLNTVSEGVLSTDTEGHVIYANQAALQLTGLKESDVRGLSLPQVFPLVDEETGEPCSDLLAPMYGAPREPVLCSGRSLVTRTGHQRPVEYSIVRMRGAGGALTGVVLVFRDMSAARAAGEEKRRDERLDAVGRLAGGIAHDFNNLLTGILGNVSMPGGQPASGPAPKRLQDAERMALRGKEIAAQLLTFARGGAPVRATADLGGLVSQIAPGAARAAGVRLDLSVPSDLWQADIDQTQIAQVIGQLVQNAQQAMPSGGMIRVSCRNLLYQPEATPQQLPLRAGRYIEIAVRDEGEGIQPRNLRVIFDPYFTTKARHSGLGLACAYSIVKNHGGFIAAESEVGVGSIFRVYLPAAGSAAAQVPAPFPPEEIRDPASEMLHRASVEPPRSPLPAAKPAANVPPPAPVRVPAPAPVAPVAPKPEPAPAPDRAAARLAARVLVVDDEEVIRSLVAEALAPLGCEVDTVASGEEALELFRDSIASRQPFELVLLDLTLPGGMPGEEVMAELKAMWPEVCGIVSSGYANTPVLSDHTRYGFSAVLPKPYRVADLIETVRKVLSEHRRAAA